MTTLTTEREILLPHNGRVPQLDRSPAPARAGASIPVTVRVGKLKAVVAGQARRWWVWTSRPASLRAVMRMSAVSTKRIPGNSRLLRILWQISNWTDRILLFGLILIAPTFLQGPLRWIAERPTRRLGLYLSLAVLATTYII